jgi:curved DNA-binding protein CbpA
MGPFFPFSQCNASFVIIVVVIVVIVVLFYQLLDKYGKKGLGTSAASDKLKAKGKKSFPRRITSTYKMAQSDMGDVKWYGGSPFGTIPLCERTFGSSREGVAGGSSMTIAASKNKGPPRRDLYQLLSLSRKASLEEITQKHKLLSKRYDPEHKENQDCNKECYILYHQVQRAVEVLSDPRLRKRYDMYGFKGLTLEESPSTTEDDVEDPLSVLRKSMKQVANTPPPSPVLAGGVPHSSRISSIQRDRVQPAAETGSEHKEFKAPPAQYRTTLAPIPLENENERFQNLAKSDSVSIKASSRSKQKDEATPLPPTFADLEMTFSSLETVTVKADASNLSKTADAVSRPVQAGGTPRPAVQAGGVPNSSRMTSIQKDRIPQASRTASMDQKAFKAPPAEYRTTLAPIPLANENARFDDLANNDSIPLKAAKKKPQDEAMALPPTTTTSTAIASAKSQILFPILDTVNIKRTAETGKQRRNHIAIKRKAGVVSADQDKVIAPRASHKKAKEALHWELDHGRMEISSRMNHQNNIDASHRAPINAGPTISVPGQDKLRPGVKATVKTKAASEDRRTAIHSIPTIGAPVKELDPYQVLSVDTTVDTAELREVYNRLTNEHFADRNKNKTSYILYQTIQQAFKILRDPEKRQAYDMLGMKGVEAILAEKRTVVPPEDKAPELASQVDDVESDSTVPSTVQVEKFPDLPDPDLSKKPKLSLDRDIVATKPSSSDLIQTARKRKNFKAPPTKYRITLAPIPVEEKDERFDALTRSQSVPLKAAIKKKAARPTPSTVGGAGAPNASRTTSIQRERIQPARTTGSEGGKFKAPPAQYRITLAPIPLENENARFDALTRSESVPLKAPSTTSKKQAAKSRQSR